MIFILFKRNVYEMFMKEQKQIESAYIEYQTRQSLRRNDEDKKRGVPEACRNAGGWESKSEPTSLVGVAHAFHSWYKYHAVKQRSASVAGHGR
jgi:hypothetical protein